MKVSSTLHGDKPDEKVEKVNTFSFRFFVFEAHSLRRAALASRAAFMNHVVVVLMVIVTGNPPPPPPNWNCHFPAFHTILSIICWFTGWPWHWQSTWFCGYSFAKARSHFAGQPGTCGGQRHKNRNRSKRARRKSLQLRGWRIQVVSQLGDCRFIRGVNLRGMLLLLDFTNPRTVQKDGTQVWTDISANLYQETTLYTKLIASTKEGKHHELTSYRGDRKSVV